MLIARLLVIPFLALSLMAPGTMLTSGPDEAGHIVICTGTGPLEMVRGPDGELHPVEDRDDHDRSTLCDWVIHAQPALGTDAAAPVSFVAAELPVQHLALKSLSHLSVHVSASYPRGPPRMV